MKVDAVHFALLLVKADVVEALEAGTVDGADAVVGHEEVLLPAHKEVFALLRGYASAGTARGCAAIGGARRVHAAHNRGAGGSRDGAGGRRTAQPGAGARRGARLGTIAMRGESGAQGGSERPKRCKLTPVVQVDLVRGAPALVLRQKPVLAADDLALEVCR